MKQILFVEDDIDIRDAFTGALVFAGWSIAQVSNGADALMWLAANESPAAILLDLEMPICDGYEFRRRQLADPRLARIPIVVFSERSILNEEAKQLFESVMVVPKTTEYAELASALAPYRHR